MSNAPALRKRIPKHMLILAGVAMLVAPLGAQETGITSRLHFGGDMSTVGQIYKLEPSVGYRFNRNFSVSTGLPIYFVRPSTTAVTDGFTSRNGIGNAYVDLKLETAGSDVYFASVLRGNAPTGDKDSGFSTGRATFDWSNYVSRTFDAVTPFASAGVANTVSDTHFFTRPFTTLGTVGHFEGGAEVELWQALTLAGSAYAVVPTGRQTVYSKVSRGRGAASGANPGRGRGREFETEAVVVGDAEIARDHGASVWMSVAPARHVNLELGYSRSIRYQYNSIFFGIHFDLGALARAGRP